jgi:hypothetical protein
MEFRPALRTQPSLPGPQEFVFFSGRSQDRLPSKKGGRRESARTGISA